MNLTSVLGVLKSLVPVLEPLGEQGIQQLFSIVDAEIAKFPPSSDLADILPILSTAVKQILILELKKMAK